VLARVLAKPPTQDVVQTSFEVASDYFSALRPERGGDDEFEALVAEAESYGSAGGTPDGGVPECLAIAPGLAAEVAAMRLLSGLGYGVLRPVLRDTTAIGSLMRRKIAPVVEPVLGRIRLLRGGRG
jgi:hypothetical protein